MNIKKFIDKTYKMMDGKQREWNNFCRLKDAIKQNRIL